MNQKTKDFIVNSKGYCFICLNKVPNTSIKFQSNKGNSQSDSEATCSVSSAHYRLHAFSQYVNMDLTKVFNEKDFISPSLLAKVQQSKLEVELCEECVSLANSFSSLYRQWEKLEMEMKLKLGRIQENLQRATESGSGEELRRFGKSEEDKGLLEVLEILRTEAIEKCSSILENPAPRVKIQRLTKQEVKAQLAVRKKRKASEPKTDVGFRFQLKNENTMESQAENLSMDDQDPNNGNDLFDDEAGGNCEAGAMSDSEAEITDETATQMFATIATAVLSMSTKGSDQPKPKYSFDPTTGKRKCELCLIEFGSRQGFEYHYKTVHLKVRYQCGLCDKIFSQRPSYNHHLRSIHQGVRFKCVVCNHQFTRPSDLARHQRQRINCENGNAPKTL